MRPSADALQAGPGQFRSFPPGSRFIAEGSLYAKRPDSTEVYTQDFSRINDDRHRWNRLDSFQTPYGHLGAEETKEDSTTVWSGDLRALLRELLDEIRFEIHQERSSLNQEFDQAVAAIHAEVRSRSDANLEEIKSFVGKTMGDAQSDIKSHLVTTIGRTESALKLGLEASKVDCRVDLTPVMASIDSQIKSVVDKHHQVNNMLESTSHKQADAITRIDLKLSEVTSQLDSNLQGVAQTSDIHHLAKTSDVRHLFDAISSIDAKVDALEKDQMKTQNYAAKSSDIHHLFDAISAIDAKVDAAETRPTAVHVTSDSGPLFEVLKAISSLETKVYEKKRFCGFSTTDRPHESS
jgi:hypothetical protein